MSNQTPSLGEATKVWAKIGVLSFGGPAAQIALMHREIVEARKWLSEKQFLNALSFCMLLPGPEAMQLATYSGWRLHGTMGGLIAGLLFVLPGAAVILLLAALYATFGNVPFVNALFLGVKATVVVIVIEALLRVAKKALHSTVHWIIAALAFVSIFILDLPYPLIIAIAAAFGFLTSQRGNSNDHLVLESARPLRNTLITVATWLAIWLLPLAALYAIAPDGLLVELGVFFSKLAVVTFGGAYAVLAYMAQDVVGVKGWLTAQEMMDGLGLAETTPGPLILVTQFVGFLSAQKQFGLGMGVAASIVTLWVTFAPCFLWIFAGAPYIDWLASRPKLKGALDAITAAVVGVILNLSIWFGLHVFFATVDRVEAGPVSTWIPQLNTLDWKAVLLCAFAATLLLYLHRGILLTLAVCAAGGVFLSAI